MNTRGLLDQLLKSGQDMLQNKTGGQRKQDDKGALGGGLGSLLGGAGGGALAAGAMGLLLGNKKARKFGGKPTATGKRSRPTRLRANRKPSTACHRPRSSSTARGSSRHWSPPPRPTAMWMNASAH
jgi:hypothetical protein